MAERTSQRTTLIVGVAIAVILALITVPLWSNSSRQASRDEVARLVDQIRLAELTYHEAFGEYVSAEAAPRGPTEVGPEAVPWTSTRGFDRLSWPEPSLVEGGVFGSYRVVATAEGFTVTGVCDVDGDGERAVFEATQDEPAHLTTAANVY